MDASLPPSMKVAAGNSSHVIPMPKAKNRPGIDCEGTLFWLGGGFGPIVFVSSFERVQCRGLLMLLPARMIADAVGGIGVNGPAEVAISVTLSPVLLPFD